MSNTIGTKNESTRNEWLAQALRKIPEGLTILDAGAGESQFKKYCPHLKYIAQDFGKYDGGGVTDVALQTGTWDNSKLDIVSDITQIPLPDNSVDAIMCTEVMEHLPNPVLAIKEFSRLVKLDGYLILTAPFASLVHFAPYHFASGFSRYFYEKYLPEYGFDIKDLQFNGNFFEYLGQETRRIGFCAQKYANKKLTTLDKILLKVHLKLLGKFSRLDKNSHELLCFGLHIFARKKVRISTEEEK
jgi:ubiquinone/menaquinone biosynthesis C-methylase UbiE